MPELELVVARYDEDLAWLRRMPKPFEVTVYNKGDDPDGAKVLPNAGREAHTYLHHVLSRYDELAALTVFCQGRPFDHAPSLHRQLRRLARGEASVEAFQWLGFIIDWDDRTGSRLFRGWSKNRDGRPLDMDGFWRALWDTAAPERLVFFPGAQFMVTSAQVHTQPRRFYERALEVSVKHPDAAHCFERCWDRVFGANGIPEEFRGRDLPVYLRPVRRLGITWSSVPKHHRGW